MKESIAKLHNLCEDWKRELKFFKDEIPLLRKRLDEVVSKNTATDVLQEVEHFENKFKILSTHVDELLHDINIKTDELTAQAATQAKYINVKMFDADTVLEDLMLSTSKDFHETKNSYYKFLSKVM
jgi:archaellum component FlaC